MPGLDPGLTFFSRKRSIAGSSPAMTTGKVGAGDQHSPALAALPWSASIPRSENSKKPREDAHGGFAGKVHHGSCAAGRRLSIADGVTRGAIARFRFLQSAGAADLPAEARRPYPLLRLPRREQQRIPARTARARRKRVDRGAVAQEFRDGRDPGEPGRSRDQPAVAATAR